MDTSTNPVDQKRQPKLKKRGKKRTQLLLFLSTNNQERRQCNENKYTTQISARAVSQSVSQSSWDEMLPLPSPPYMEC